MNILFGMSVISATGGYEGRILLNGEPVTIDTPAAAMEYGIGMVHQEFMLIPGFTVAENIKLNREPTKKSFLSGLFGKRLMSVDNIKVEQDARAALDKLGMDLDENAVVGGLPVGYMQFVEIAREIDKEGIRLLVFDEPTAVLTESEADRLLDAMRKLAAQGVGILFITHRLHEVMEVADDITILRDGELVANMKKTDTDMVRMAELMVGRAVETDFRQERGSEGQESKTVMSIRNLKVHMPGEAVRGIDLDIREGEILGLGGLAGQGTIGIANGIMGLYPSSGEVTFQGKQLPLNQPKAAIAAHLGFVSEDRRGVGLLLDTSIEMNMVIPMMVNQGKFLKKFLFFSQVNRRAVRANAKRFIKELDIRCTGPAQPVQRLSGGNQQKVCIARALTLEPTVLFVSEPTRGIDIGAKQIVMETLVKLNREYGITVVMTSSELAELRSICDRVAVVNEGRVTGILAPDAPDAEFGLLMAAKTGKKEA